MDMARFSRLRLLTLTVLLAGCGSHPTPTYVETSRLTGAYECSANLDTLTLFSDQTFELWSRDASGLIPYQTCCGTWRPFGEGPDWIEFRVEDPTMALWFRAAVGATILSVVPNPRSGDVTLLPSTDEVTASWAGWRRAISTTRDFAAPPSPPR